MDSGWSAAGDMRGNASPLAVLARPDVGVAAGALLSVGSRVAGAGVDDRDIAENPDLDVMRRQIRDSDRLRGLGQKAGAVQQRAVRVRATEVGGQDLLEAADIAVLDRADVVAVEAGRALDSRCCLYPF